MQVEEKIVQSSSGNPISLRVGIPGLSPKGVVQINTGTCIPQRVYWLFAEYLTQQGYITITYDYTGAQQLDAAVTHTVWVQDMESVFAYVLETYPGLRKIVVGHSSGGQLIGMMRNADRIDRIFLVASSNGYWKLLDSPFKYAMWLFWHLVVPVNLRIFGYFNNRMFGTGGGFPRNIILELRAFCHDPEFFMPYFRRHGFIPGYDRIRSQLTAYHLEGDRIANERACRYIAGLYTNADLNFVTLQGRDHGVSSFGHRSFFSVAFPGIWEVFLKDLESGC